MKSINWTLLLFVLLTLNTTTVFAQNVFQGPVDDNTYMSTVRLSNLVTQKIFKKVKNKTIVKDTSVLATGTGFVVFRVMPDKTYRFFLVTNKHMIGDWSLNDSLIVNSQVIVSFYTKNNLFKNITIKLLDNSNRPAGYVHAYPNQVVDVAVIELTGFLSNTELNEIAFYAIPIDNLISLSNLSRYNIFTGSQVLITGYPSGIGIASQSKPVVKSAIISSPLTSTIDINMVTDNRKHNPTLNNIYGKLILIDGYIVGGNSGGPVFTPRDKVILDANTNLGQYNYVIGIVSSVYNNTGLSLIYSTDYIKDLIYQYTKL